MAEQDKFNMQLDPRSGDIQRYSVDVPIFTPHSSVEKTIVHGHEVKARKINPRTIAKYVLGMGNTAFKRASDTVLDRESAQVVDLEEYRRRK